MTTVRFLSKEDRNSLFQVEITKFQSQNLQYFSGCPNCVWLEHADELIEFYGKQGKEEAIAAIKKNVEDPMLQQLLIMEIKFK